MAKKVEEKGEKAFLESRVCIRCLKAQKKKKRTKQSGKKQQSSIARRKGATTTVHTHK